jgi:hypothetical protein
MNAASSYIAIGKPAEAVKLIEGQDVPSSIQAYSFAAAGLRDGAERELPSTVAGLPELR